MLLGYDAGRSDAEVSRQRREIVDRVFYGQRPVQVDQSYLDQLHQLLDSSARTSITTSIRASSFATEALDWKGKAEQFHGEALSGEAGRSREADAKALQAQLAERDAALDQAQAALLGSGPSIKRPTKKSGASTSSV